MLNRLMATVQRTRQAFTPRVNVPHNMQTLSVPSHVQTQIDKDGLVLVNIRRGLIFRTNSIGARIWQGLAAREGACILNALATEYQLSPDQVESGTAQFVSDLLKYGLLTRQ
jgi:hypothetical protein